NHPNFGWGGNQNPRNNNFQNRAPFPPQQRPPYQQPQPLPQQNNIQPPPKPQHNSFEASLEKLTLTTSSFVQSTNNFMEETRANFRNQESAIRNLETQVGQIAKQLSTTLPNAFPSDTQENPRGECKAVILRSGRALANTKAKDLNQQKSDEEVTRKSPKEAQKPAEKSEMQCTKENTIPFPQQLQKEIKDN
ncbi:hypothetical protein PIB30_113614, partial [Stylosanthes scabra]|nr:hypothetical protein [Stylosanthes scabra]